MFLNVCYASESELLSLRSIFRLTIVLLFGIRTLLHKAGRAGRLSRLRDDALDFATRFLKSRSEGMRRFLYDMLLKVSTGKFTPVTMEGMGNDCRKELRCLLPVSAEVFDSLSVTPVAPDRIKFTVRCSLLLETLRFAVWTVAVKYLCNVAWL